jgi:transposase-like protein
MRLRADELCELSVDERLEHQLHAARPCRNAIGNCWYVDETYVKVAGLWRYVYRAVDQHGQVIDVYVSPRRDTHAGRRFFAMALGDSQRPVEVVTDRTWPLRAVVDELMPERFTTPSSTRTIGSKPCTARVIINGHAFMQNLRRGHYELGVDARPCRRVAVAFTDLAHVI